MFLKIVANISSVVIIDYKYPSIDGQSIDCGRNHRLSYVTSIMYIISCIIFINILVRSSNKWVNIRFEKLY
jgi:hypothetical protein